MPPYDRELGYAHKVMADVAASLSEPGDLVDTLTRISSTARDTVPGADYASITVRHADGRLETLATTDALVIQADAIQYELREGPCYDAVTETEASYCADLGTDTQWPTYGPRARLLGLRSQLAIRLSATKGAYTGLNLYATEPDAFSEEPMDVARLFSSHAQVALGFARELESLKGAVGTRQVIGEAMGIVMERYGLTQERSFEFLIRMSQTSNIKLREVARGIVESSSSAAAPSLSDAG